MVNIIKIPQFAGFFYSKRATFLLLFLSIIQLSFSQAIAKVDDPKKNFGFVKKGEVVELKYEIKNIGNEPLLIQKYEAECTCTSVSFDEKPVLPGATVSVIVKFDTKTTYDRQDRTVVLLSNNKNGAIKLRFKGVVLRKEKGN